MAITPFRQIPKDLRDWSRFFDDVSVVADDLSVTTAKIANGAVTYAKIQNVTDSRLLGRGPAVPGVAQEIAVTGGLEFSGTSVQIANDGVTYAKIQNLTSSRLLGRTTAASGDCEEIVVASPLSFSALSLGVNISALLTALNIASGTYTPTLFNTTNVAGSTAYEAQYMRVGATVTVSGKVDLDPTAAVSTVLGISIPVSSNFGAAEDCAGTAFSPTIAGQGAAILADAANDRALLQYIAVDVTNQPFYYSFSYQII